MSQEEILAYMIRWFEYTGVKCLFMGCEKDEDGSLTIPASLVDSVWKGLTTKWEDLPYDYSEVYKRYARRCLAVMAKQENGQ